MSHKFFKGHTNLDRKFRAFIKQDNEDAAYYSYINDYLGDSGSLSWSDLLKEKLVIVLGEPGSGKTWEFVEQARVNKTSDIFSFFISLDKLRSNDLKNILNAKEYKDFTKWLKSKKEAVFFLDSVDESKFHKEQDFYDALNVFSNLIQLGLHRARIFLSCRITQWKPYTDEQQVIRYLGYERGEKEAGKLLKPSLVESKNANLVESKADTYIKLKVVNIQPLDEKRVRIFAESRGVADVDDFIAAIEKNHLWELVRRPFDVIEAINYWLDKKRLGTLTEMLDYFMSSLLKETTERQSTNSLAFGEALNGAQTLAAATILCRNFNFRIPDNSMIINSSLDASKCLPLLWTEKNILALLTRPIFDGQGLGQIRFHHRRISEYLAAEWLMRCINNGYQKNDLFKLLFADVVGEKIVRPALKPIAAWLAIKNESWSKDLHEQILKYEPTLHLSYGDPASLSLDYRKKILEKIAQQGKTSENSWISSSKEMLAKIAHKDIEQEISAYINDPEINSSTRAEFLLIARHSNLTGCNKAVLEVIKSTSSDDTLKSYAASVIRDIGSVEDRKQLLQIALSLTEISVYTCMLVIEATYPSFANANDILALLTNSTDKEDYRAYAFEAHIKKNIDVINSSELLNAFLKLLMKTPLIQEGGEKLVGVSKKYAWVVPLLYHPLLSILQKPTLLDNDIKNAVLAFEILGRKNEYKDSEKDYENLNKASHNHPDLRREYFWNLAVKYRKIKNKEPEYHNLSGYYEFIQFDSTDLSWLEKAIKSQDSVENKALAMKFIFPLQQGKKKLAINRNIKKAIKEPALQVLFVDLKKQFRFFYIRRIWYKISQRILSRWYWLGKYNKLRKKYKFLREQYLFFRYLNFLSTAKRLDWLGFLLQESNEANNSWSKSNWKNLRKKRGWLIAKAVKNACKVSWRKYSPPLPHEMSPNQVPYMLIIGLSGIQSDLDDRALSFYEVTSEEAQLLSRYGVNELNGCTEWLHKLAQAQPLEVKKILSDCVKGEWKISASEGVGVQGIMRTLSWNDQDISRLILEDIWIMITLADPENKLILESAMQILLKHEYPSREELAKLSSSRINIETESDKNIRWLVIILLTQADVGLETLKKYLEQHEKSAVVIMTAICSMLNDRSLYKVLTLEEPSYEQSRNLQRLINLAFEYIKSEDDITHEGAYSPSDRDYAQSFRDSLFGKLQARNDSDAGLILSEFVEDPKFASKKEFLKQMLYTRLQRLADLQPWQEEDIRKFENEFEIEPKIDRDLYEIGKKRVYDIKLDIEKSDNSLRSELRKQDEESELRKWLQRKLIDRANGLYNVPQEGEIDHGERPDLRIQNPKTNPISIEIKWAENWNMDQLLAGLEEQLVGKYLRAHNSHYGLYIIGFIKEKYYCYCPQSKKQLPFEEVLVVLKAQAAKIIKSNPNVEGLEIIGMDFHDPKVKKTK